MRTKRFDHFLTHYAKAMNSKVTLRFKSCEEEAKSNHRFLTLFSLALLFDAKRAKMLVEHGDLYPTLLSSYLETKQHYANVSLHTIDDETRKLGTFDELHKAYQSYLRLVVHSRDQSKKTSLQEIKSLMSAKGITKYRIYTDLQLNPGNINAFLKNEQYAKVSKKTVERILDYCRSEPVHPRHRMIRQA